MVRALVTGATGNVGRACCELFGAAGWGVTRVSRELGLDLTDEKIVSERMEIGATKLREKYDLVVMAHGVQRTCWLADADEDEWDYLIGNNLRSCVILSRNLLLWDLVLPGGLVIYCSSIQASHPRLGRALYAMAMAGKEALMRAAAVEWADRGVRCVALRLGQLTTTMKGVEFDPAQAEAIRERTPLPWVEPRDVAKLCLSLYGQQSLTGAVIELNSGHHLSVWPT